MWKWVLLYVAIVIPVSIAMGKWLTKLDKEEEQWRNRQRY